MTNRLRAKAGIAALACVLAVSGAAQAQPSARYDEPYGRYGYDPCRREANQRGTAGVLVGGGIGAAIGSNMAARNARPEGALLGGLLGAIAGGVMGKKTAACNTGRYDHTQTAADDRYADRDRDGWRRPDRYDDRAAPEGRFETPRDGSDCHDAESTVRMPDGTTQARTVEVCRNASGRYEVVD